MGDKWGTVTYLIDKIGDCPPFISHLFRVGTARISAPAFRCPPARWAASRSGQLSPFSVLPQLLPLFSTLHTAILHEWRAKALPANRGIPNRKKKQQSHFSRIHGRLPVTNSSNRMKEGIFRTLLKLTHSFTIFAAWI